MFRTRRWIMAMDPRSRIQIHFAQIRSEKEISTKGSVPVTGTWGRQEARRLRCLACDDERCGPSARYGPAGGCVGDSGQSSATIFSRCQRSAAAAGLAGAGCSWQSKSRTSSELPPQSASTQIPGSRFAILERRLSVTAGHARMLIIFDWSRTCACAAERPNWWQYFLTRRPVRTISVMCEAARPVLDSTIAQPVEPTSSPSKSTLPLSSDGSGKENFAPSSAISTS